MALGASEMLTYEEARARMIETLRRDAAVHDAGRYDEIGGDYDQIAAAMPRNGGPAFNKLLVALSFWDSWIR